jgi:hypothetical protein
LRWQAFHCIANSAVKKNQAIIGLISATAIYIFISLLAGLLFKTTEHHAGVVRWGFGMGGAICGMIYGFLLLWGGITMIRGLGALGEMRLVNAGLEGRSEQSERASLFFLKLKKSLELGATGRALKSADPLPSSFYDNIVKISMVAGDQQALERFCQYPETLKIIANPHITALLQDPELEKASRSRNILPLIHNKHVQAAMNDPKLIAEFQAFDLTAALDYALAPQMPVRNPSQRSPQKPGRGKITAPKSTASSPATP